MSSTPAVARGGLGSAWRRGMDRRAGHGREDGAKMRVMAAAWWLRDWDRRQLWKTAAGVREHGLVVVGAARWEELVKEYIAKRIELVQAIANNFFNLPSTEDIEGPLVKLPPPTTRFPIEKHVSNLS
ncbi:hypothetical protein M0R45_000542 [Rubus argutus]|uniref:Ribosome biogenesis regulatory protein n=1 Tax=Rubus argutus TaxID=59490 RepID=A0AAW1VKJ7_RUBAR